MYRWSMQQLFIYVAAGAVIRSSRLLRLRGGTLRSMAIVFPYLPQ